MMDTVAETAEDEDRGATPAQQQPAESTESSNPKQPAPPSQDAADIAQQAKDRRISRLSIAHDAASIEKSRDGKGRTRRAALRGEAQEGEETGGKTAASKRSKSKKMSLPAEEVTVFIHDASFFGVAERGLWHYANIGANLPKKLWREKDGLTILSCTTRMSTAISHGYVPETAVKEEDDNKPPSGMGTVGRLRVETGASGTLDAPSAPDSRANITNNTEYSTSHAKQAPEYNGSPNPAFMKSPEGLQAAAQPFLSSEDLPSAITLKMANNTATRYIYAKYRFVIAVDVSPSMFALDSHSLEVPFSEAFETLCTFLRGLVSPMPCTPPHILKAFVNNIHNKNSATDIKAPAPIIFSPEIHLSVIAQAAYDPGRAHDKFRYPPPRTLIHGYALTSDNIDAFISTLAAGWRSVEAEWFENQRLQEGALPHAAAESALRDMASKRPDEALGLHLPGPALSSLIESAVNTLKLLPPTACPGVVLLTDCAAGLPASSSYGSIIMQMLRHDISCSVLQLGTCSGVHSSLGEVPDTESMAHLALSTGGFRVRKRDLKGFADIPAQAKGLLLRFHAVQQGVSPGAEGSMSKAPGFSTALWSAMQQQVFVRTSVLSVGRMAQDEAITAAITRATGTAMGARAAPARNPRNDSSHADVSFDGRPVPTRNRAVADSFGASLAKAVVGAKRFDKSDAAGVYRSVSHADYAFPWSGPPPPVQYHRIVLRKYAVRADPSALLECRLKEGFRVLMGASGVFVQAEAEKRKDSGHSSIMQLVLAWQPHIMIIYSTQVGQAAADDRQEPGGRHASQRSVASQRTDGLKSGAAPGTKARSRRRMSDVSGSTVAAPKRHQLVHVTIEISGRQDFVHLFLEVAKRLQADTTGPSGKGPASVKATSVRMFARLSPSAVEPQKAVALYEYLMVMQQVDSVLVHICNPPTVAELPDVATSSKPEASIGTKPSASAQPLTILDRRKMLMQSALTEEVSVAPETLESRPAVPPELSSLRVSADSPAHIPLMYAPIGSLSLAAWHRWFDVERFEVVVSLPSAILCHLLGERCTVDKAAIEAQSQEISAPLETIATPPLESMIIEHVHSCIDAWATGMVPAADNIFAFAAEGAAPSDADTPKVYIKFVGSSNVKTGTSAPQPATLSTTITEIDSETPTAAPTVVNTTARPYNPAGSTARGFDAMSQSGRFTTPVGAKATVVGPSTRSHAFMLVRPALHSTMKQTEGAVNGSALVVIHVAFFSCPPPVRKAQLLQLKTAVSVPFSMQVPLLIHEQVTELPEVARPTSAASSPRQVTTSPPELSDVASPRTHLEPSDERPEADVPAGPDDSFQENSDPSSAMTPVRPAAAVHPNVSTSKRATVAPLLHSPISADSIVAPSPPSARSTMSTSVPASEHLHDFLRWEEHGTAKKLQFAPELVIRHKYIDSAPMPLELNSSVTPCPLSRILLPAFGSHTAHDDSQTESEEVRFLHEMRYDSFAASSCCGGTSIPKKILRAMLWHRRWSYYIDFSDHEQSRFGVESVLRSVLMHVIANKVGSRHSDAVRVGHSACAVQLSSPPPFAGWEIVEWSRRALSQADAFAISHPPPPQQADTPLAAASAEQTASLTPLPAEERRSLTPVQEEEQAPLPHPYPPSHDDDHHHHQHQCETKQWCVADVILASITAVAVARPSSRASVCECSYDTSTPPQQLRSVNVRDDKPFTTAYAVAHQRVVGDILRDVHGNLSVSVHVDFWMEPQEGHLLLCTDVTTPSPTVISSSTLPVNAATGVVTSARGLYSAFCQSLYATDLQSTRDALTSGHRTRACTLRIHATDSMNHTAGFNSDAARVLSTVSASELPSFSLPSIPEVPTEAALRFKPATIQHGNPLHGHGRVKHVATAAAELHISAA